MIRVLPYMTPRGTVRDIIAALSRKRESAKTLAGKNPTRVEQARIETLDMVINDLSSISYSQEKAQ